MNITPPNSGAVTAHGAAAAQPKNLSLADLLFADSPANAGSDFRAIAATLFDVGGSTETQSPVKASSIVKKPVSGVSEEKTDAPRDKDASIPTLSDIPVQLLVPPPVVPLPVIQISVKPDASDDRKLNANAGAGATQLDSKGLLEETQLKSDANTAANLRSVALPDDHIPLAPAPKTGTPPVEALAAENIAKPMSASGAIRKKDVESTKATADRPQVPIPQSGKAAIPQSVHPPAPAPATTDRTKPSTDLNFSGGQEKASVAFNAAPPTPPVEPTPDTPASKIVDSVVAAKAVPQSELANPAAVPSSKVIQGRNASKTSASTRGHETKDSRLTPASGGKPGFIQTVQTTGGTSAAGDGKNSPGFSLSDHSGGHGKPVALKPSVGSTSSPASLADVDGPDETLPTSDSSPISAKLVQGMSQSEFRVGMQSQEFGNIDIRTSITRHMFSAQISVEHSDVAKSMTAQLPGLFHRLADQQVLVGNIVIQGQSLGTSSGLAQDAQRQNWQPQGHSAGAGTTKLNAEPVLPVITDGVNPAGRLDIRI